MVTACLLLSACSTVEDAPKGEAAYAVIPPAPAVGMDYRISPVDVLRIQVYHEPGLSLEDEGQLPPEVERVLHTAVHPLAAGRRMHMR